MEIIERRKRIEESRTLPDGTVERWSWTQPAIGKCFCGRQVTLAGFTNACDCGRDYNSAGQMLAPREQWGEETGESVSDILAVDSMTTEELLDSDY